MTFKLENTLKQICLSVSKVLSVQDKILVVQHQPVINIGWWYTDELRDKKRAKEIPKQTTEGFKSIEKCGLTGKP